MAYTNLLNILELSRRADAVRQEKEKLAGLWVITSAVVDGQEDRLRTGAKVTFIGDAVIRSSAEEKMLATYRLERGGRINKYAITIASGAEIGETRQGILAFDGATLTICTAPPGKRRPLSFDSRPGSGNRLLFLRRPDQAQR
jgi:uncharacterized protein (TIGR03067 family)